jgi:hypothetical protein
VSKYFSNVVGTYGSLIAFTLISIFTLVGALDLIHKLDFIITPLAQTELNKFIESKYGIQDNQSKYASYFTMSGEEFNNIRSGKTTMNQEWEDFTYYEQFFNRGVFTWTFYFSLLCQIVIGSYAVFFFLQKYLLVQDPITGTSS